MAMKIKKCKLLPGGGSTALGDGEILRLWDKYGMPENIRDHSVMVCRVALHVYGGLDGVRDSLSLEDVRDGALLHDIAKMKCLREGGRHDVVGGQILQEEGHQHLAQIVREHVNLQDTDCIDNKMVVFYADKRVNDDRLVTLKERYEYIIGRYGQGRAELIERLTEGYRRAIMVEGLLCRSMEDPMTDCSGGIIIPVEENER